MDKDLVKKAAVHSFIKKANKEWTRSQKRRYLKEALHEIFMRLREI